MQKYIKLTARVQFEIHPRCHETKLTSNEPGTVHHVLTVTLLFFHLSIKYKF